jgi:hypothetical protein
MRGKSIALTPMRCFIGDLLYFSSGVPTVPVERRMNLQELVRAYANHSGGLSWTAIFTRAYARVADRVPELRRAYVKLPYPHLYEFPTSVASIAVEREWRGENVVCFGRVKNPAGMTLQALTAVIRGLQQAPVTECKAFRQALWLGSAPWLVRRLLWWVGLNFARQRGNFFGTFGLTVYAALGASSLHPLTPLTSTLTYGVIGSDGVVPVRIIYDHRVLDGATIARALEHLEEELRGDTLTELRTFSMPLLHDVRQGYRTTTVGIP